MKQQQAPVYIEIDYYGTKLYYSDREMTVRHRLDGPAVEYADGTKTWWQNGRLHRADGPAVEWADGTKTWWQNGRRHRADGPAVEEAAGYKAWYVNGERLTEAEFLAATTPKEVHELSLDDIAARLGIAVENLKIVEKQ